jgi:hypothetical protein
MITVATATTASLVSMLAKPGPAESSRLPAAAAAHGHDSYSHCCKLDKHACMLAESGLCSTLLRRISMRVNQLGWRYTQAAAAVHGLGISCLQPKRQLCG